MKTLVAIVCLLALVTVVAQAQGPAGVSSKLDLGYVTKDMFRGTVINSDPVFAPSFTFSHPTGISLNLSGAMDTTGIADNSGNFTKLFYTLNYATKFQGYKTNVGVSYYTYPNTGGESTSEVYAGTTFNALFAPTVTVYYDYDKADGFYATLGGSYSYAIPGLKVKPVAFNASVAYATSNLAGYYYHVDKSAFTNAELSASLPFVVNSKLTVIPTVGYSMLIDSDVRDAQADPDNFFAGLTMSSSF